MKKGLLAVAITIGLPVLAVAQVNRGSSNGHFGDHGNPYNNTAKTFEPSTLSIFTENGEPFFLVLNGVKQNLVAQSKIRVEALPQFANDVQIYFPNSNTKPIRKKINAADPVDGNAVSLTLKVVIGRGGFPELRFHKMSGCDHNYHGPKDEYVMYYGKPQQINTITETTYTDPITGELVTQTTTTSTTTDNYGSHTGYSNGRGNNYGNTPPTPQPPLAMSDAAFSDAKQSIASSSFEDTKLSTAKTILAANYVTTQQVIDMCGLFSFENTKLTFAKFAYGRTVDPVNYYRVANVLDFDANKKALNTFISTGK